MQTYIVSARSEMYSLQNKKDNTDCSPKSQIKVKFQAPKTSICGY